MRAFFQCHLLKLERFARLKTVEQPWTTKWRKYEYDLKIKQNRLTRFEAHPSLFLDSARAYPCPQRGFSPANVISYMVQIAPENAIEAGQKLDGARA